VSPSGESGNLCDAQHAGPHRKTRRQWSSSAAGPMVCHRSHGWRGMLLHLPGHPSEATNRPRGEAIVLALAQREGPGASWRVCRRSSVAVGSVSRRETALSSRGAFDRRPHGSDPPALRAFPCGDTRRGAVQASRWCARWLCKATICSVTACDVIVELALPDQSGKAPPLTGHTPKGA